jgi:hypothetical protein
MSTLKQKTQKHSRTTSGVEIPGQIDLQTYDYLEFKKSITQFSTICRLNCISCTKQEYLQKLTTFVETEFRKNQFAFKNSTIPTKQIYLKNSTLVNLCLQAIKSIEKFNWEVTYFDEEKIKKLEFVLSDKFENELEMIDLSNLVSDKKFEKIQYIFQWRFSYNFVNLIALILNFNGVVAYSRKKIEISSVCLYQAIMVKEIFKTSMFDFVYGYFFSVNFLKILQLKNLPNRYFTLLRNLIMFTEKWEDKIVTKGEVRLDQVDHFQKSFEFFDLGFLDVEFHDKIFKENFGFEEIEQHSIYSKSETFSRTFSMTVSKTQIQNKKISIELINQTIQKWLHIMLINYYKHLAELFHQKGNYKESYNCQNFYQKMKYKFIGEKYNISDLENSIEKIEEQKTKGNSEDRRFYKINWGVQKVKDSGVAGDYSSGDFSKAFKA